MVKVAFLFLVISSIYHEEYWSDFFCGYQDYYSVYIHSKEPFAVESSFKCYELDEKVATSWSNTVYAQRALLREALKDPDNQKFVFLSESTIPFCDFLTTYEFLTRTDKSMFPFVSNQIHLDSQRVGTFWAYANYQPRRDLHPIPPRFQYRTTQWIVLNRKHAELMAYDDKYVHMMPSVFCDNEHYPATFLAIKGLLHEIENYQTTYDDWIAANSLEHPFTFTDLSDAQQYERAIKAIRGNLYGDHKYLFGRKFAKNCDLTSLDKHLAYRIIWN